MINVGCRLTSVALNEANSEYRLRTSRSYTLSESHEAYLRGWDEYPSPYRVGNVAPPTLVILPGISDKDLQVVIFIKYLLDATVIASPLTWGSLLGVFFIIVTHVPLPRDKFWRFVGGWSVFRGRSR